MAIDGDAVISVVLGWPNVRIKRYVNARFTGDIDPAMRVTMSALLHATSRSAAVPIVFNGAIIFEPNAHYAFVQPDEKLTARRYAARDSVAEAVAAKRVRLNFAANLQLYNEAPVASRGLFHDFDRASVWLDSQLLLARNQHTKMIAQRMIAEQTGLVTQSALVKKPSKGKK